MNNILYLINESDYSIDEYNNIIDECNRKILMKDVNNYQDVFKNNIQNIKINNEELKIFFNLISDSFSFNVEKTIEYETVSINFNCNDLFINLCLYYEDFQINQKLCITNKNVHTYEVFYDNYEEVLLRILDFKTTTLDELNEFIKDLFRCLPSNIVNEL
jgi:hypothetical protein